MKDAFDGIVGYEGIKKELRRIGDVLKNPEKYRELGVKIPAGMVFVGEPGTGKTTMAMRFIEMTGRKCYVCRKDRGNGAFLESIAQIFEQAKKNAPSIILLDDFDKFSDERCTNAEEFVAVQTGMDQVANSDVFVLATINEDYFLPDSLMRSGRLGRRFDFDMPTVEEAEQIIRHYLANKQVEENVDFGRIARLLWGKSCAVLENIINEAGIIAGYTGNKRISEDDIVNATLNDTFCAAGSDERTETVLNRRVACHEAGHVVVQELLDRGSVMLVSIRADAQTGTMGFVHSYVPLERRMEFEEKEREILRSLSGKAALELVYGTSDAGAYADLSDAYHTALEIVENYCSFGFDKWNYDSTDAAPVIERRNQAMAVYLEICYAKVKRMLVKNRVLLDIVCDELMEKITLTDKDIRRIEEELDDSIIAV